MEVSKINKFEGDYRFGGPRMIAESGQRLNQDVIDNIVDNAGAKSPKHKFHILLLSDNNLRRRLKLV